jgi:hypothetical protein
MPTTLQCHISSRGVIAAAATTVALISGLLIGSAHAADSKAVTLSLSIDSAGTASITVDPEDAQIWRNKPNKPKKVHWKTANSSSQAELFWELRYDPDKGGGSADYFGEVDIACGETDTKAQPDKKPDFPYAQWPYSVTVYACADGAKGQQLATVDPRIVWKD